MAPETDLATPFQATARRARTSGAEGTPAVAEACSVRRKGATSEIRPIQIGCALSGNSGIISLEMILAELASDNVLDTAHDCLCRRRRDFPADADVWRFRQRWPQDNKRIRNETPV